jgi:hypothetical protein
VLTVTYNIDICTITPVCYFIYSAHVRFIVDVILIFMYNILISIICLYLKLQLYDTIFNVIFVYLPTCVFCHVIAITPCVVLFCMCINIHTQNANCTRYTLCAH